MAAFQVWILLRIHSQTIRRNPAQLQKAMTDITLRILSASSEAELSLGW